MNRQDNLYVDPNISYAPTIDTFVDSDFALAIKLAKEEELELAKRKEEEERDAKLARQLMEEEARQARQNTRPAQGVTQRPAQGATRRPAQGATQRPAQGATQQAGRGRVVDPLEAQIANDEAIAREKQSYYTSVFAFQANDLQIARDEILAREKQNMYSLGLDSSSSNTQNLPVRTTGPLDPVSAQLACDEKMAREKQNMYTLAFDVEIQQTLQDEKLAREKQSIYSEMATIHHQTTVPVQQPSQQRNLTLNSAISGVSDELNQLVLDEEIAQSRQNVYTAQLGEVFKQIDKDEVLAHKIDAREQNDQEEGNRHQISVHNMHCRCGNTRNMNHVWEIHDSKCGCKETMQMVLPPSSTQNVEDGGSYVGGQN